MVRLVLSEEYSFIPMYKLTLFRSDIRDYGLWIPGCGDYSIPNLVNDTISSGSFAMNQPSILKQSTYLDLRSKVNIKHKSFRLFRNTASIVIIFIPFQYRFEVIFLSSSKIEIINIKVHCSLITFD